MYGSQGWLAAWLLLDGVGQVSADPGVPPANSARAELDPVVGESNASALPAVYRGRIESLHGLFGLQSVLVSEVAAALRGLFNKMHPNGQFPVTITQANSIG